MEKSFKTKADLAVGHLHPISRVMIEAGQIFAEMGFKVADGPEIETEWNNFDALNVPANHPAREMQDTFWLKSDGGKQLLRTHMTAVSLRELAKKELPLRVVSPGRVFRNEATDATHEAQFYQFDGLAIDRPGVITMAELKGTLETFYKKLFGRDLEMRFRASFFPFVKPGVEIDIKWGDKPGRPDGGWLEVCGAGLLHPNVFRAAGLDPAKWQGLAFGSTIDRLAMIKYGVEDIRHFYVGDKRFLDQF
ncbi:MAG: phenylalanine--tRNA ligase subunit alpha [Candidatus Vogelbacteria bacterium GWA1_51_14]|uniref:phenylalanine--tRNA ligase n=1 Tax=Candidatus Vogelbacteria bacterium GWA1_51_14 TaxID=1802435 RepID=A0A1G2QB17_9BACT|nr:MAG: phenylalanine--tRNA ligase subunit alpha [Candidatus Vogelbacteria bacterium GWA1_51_14]